MIAYVEGPLCFYHAALVWAWLAAADEVRSSRSVEARSLLIGLLAGGAMGCKYTALISAVIPASACSPSPMAGGAAASVPLLAFGLGWSLVMGPWLDQERPSTPAIPVYPLGYRVFHGRDWDASMEAKWQNVHGPAADLLAGARQLDRGRRGAVGLAIVALRGARTARPAATRLASDRDRPLGTTPATSS